MGKQCFYVDFKYGYMVTQCFHVDLDNHYTDRQYFRFKLQWV